MKRPRIFTSMARPDEDRNESKKRHYRGLILEYYILRMLRNVLKIYYIPTIMFFNSVVRKVKKLSGLHLCNDAMHLKS